MAQKEYDDLMAVKEAEFTEMETSYNDKKKAIGDNAATIASTDSELDTVTQQRTTDTDFLGDVATRCADKKKEYEHRNMLRANEEAAIAQAISILNSDAAFSTFGKSAASGGELASFLQTGMSKDDVVRGKAIQMLLKNSKAHHSMRLARIASALTATNPFGKVLEMIRKTIDVIAAEGKADEDKHAWCDTEQTTNTATTEDLAANRETQKDTTETRKGRNELFHENLKNLQDAQRILAKAIDVLTKYYAFLHSHNAEKSYTEHAGKDSGGANLERLAGKSQTELEEACSANPGCAGFNSAGWLKSSIAPEAEWYDWDGGSLYVKQLSFVQTDQPVEGEPETFDDTSGQSEKGNEAIEMLQFIEKESKQELSDTIDTEKEEGDFEGQMTALTTAEAELQESIGSYQLDLANTEKQREQAHEDLATTTKDHKAIVEYLASIEPGCTFIQTNIESRKQNREAETTALNEAITLLEGTPAFKAAEAAAEREALGKCAEDGQPCAPDGPGRGHAECEACLEGVTVYGYCTQNPDAGGCADATATTSADALSLAHKKSHKK